MSKLWSIWLEKKLGKEIIFEKSSTDEVKATLAYVPIKGFKIGDVVNISIFNENHQLILYHENVLLFCHAPVDSEDLLRTQFPNLKGVFFSTNWNKQFNSIEHNKKQTFVSWLIDHIRED